MKFVHFSDTHLGYSDYYKIDPHTGINQREQDFYNAWNQAIGDILQIKPDFVIHAGDLFHTSRPTNRAIAVFLLDKLRPDLPEGAPTLRPEQFADCIPELFFAAHGA